MASSVTIGVTGSNRRFAISWWCLAIAIRLAGGKPVRINVDRPDPDQPLDGIVISGGNDIGPDLYGGEAMPKAIIDHARDELEGRWIRNALRHGLPILGICRGAQLINAIMKGTLYQDIRLRRRKTSNRASPLPLKTVVLRRGSLVSRIIGRSKLRVNSLHHQAINSPGKDLTVSGRDLDRICQAIESKQRAPVVGVQWHPEYLFYLKSQRRLFRWLVQTSDCVSPTYMFDEQRVRLDA